MKTLEVLVEIDKYLTSAIQLILDNNLRAYLFNEYQELRNLRFDLNELKTTLKGQNEDI